MPEIMTRDFGLVAYADDEVFHFTEGVPGFRECRRFLTVRPDATSPLIVLQALDNPEVVFLTVPASSLALGYDLKIVAEDRRALGSISGDRLLALVIVTLPAQGAATLNLLGPIVLNPDTRRGVQAIRDDNRYGAAEPAEPLLIREQEPASCL